MPPCLAAPSLMARRTRAAARMLPLRLLARTLRANICVAIVRVSCTCAPRLSAIWAISRCARLRLCAMPTSCAPRTRASRASFLLRLALRSALSAWTRTPSVSAPKRWRSASPQASASRTVPMPACQAFPTRACALFPQRVSSAARLTFCLVPRLSPRRSWQAGAPIPRSCSLVSSRAKTPSVARRLKTCAIYRLRLSSTKVPTGWPMP